MLAVTAMINVFKDFPTLINIEDIIKQMSAFFYYRS
ncbi:hypothetical protein EDC48_101339 [Gibbsiella quercinecans]|nr:hypothetical protein EDC48_101339 [Gibbsiella quercinecans]